MLATSAALQVSLLADALLTAFAIGVGVGVASGDILVATYWQIREQIVDPVMGAVASGIDTLVTRTGEAAGSGTSASAAPTGAAQGSAAQGLQPQAPTAGRPPTRDGGPGVPRPPS